MATDPTTAPPSPTHLARHEQGVVGSWMERLGLASATRAVVRAAGSLLGTVASNVRGLAGWVSKIGRALRFAVPRAVATSAPRPYPGLGDLGRLVAPLAPIRPRPARAPAFALVAVRPLPLDDRITVRLNELQRNPEPPD